MNQNLTNYLLHLEDTVVTFQGHRVKSQGHTATIMEIYAIPSICNRSCSLVGMSVSGIITLAADTTTVFV